MRMLVRVDCDAETGFGHFSRTLNIARNVMAVSPETRVRFLGRHNDFARSLLERCGIERDEPAGAGYRVEQVKPFEAGCDAVVFDSYRIDQKFIDEASRLEAKTFFVDDFGSFKYDGIDMVLNFTIDAARAMKLGARRCFLGAGYFMAKPELRPIRLSRLGKPAGPLHRLYLFLSGKTARARPRELFLKALDAAVEGRRLRVVAPRDLARDPLARLLRRNTVEFVDPTPDVERFYEDADLTICEGGVVKYESAYCCIPNISMSHNEGQEWDSAEMARMGLSFYLGRLDALDERAAADKLRGFFADPAGAESQVRNANELFETDCGKRLAEGILSFSRRP